MSKIWKSILARMIVCPAYKSSDASPSRMEVYRAMHEQVRMRSRMRMADLGWQLTDSEIPIENAVFKGRIDDIFENKDGLFAAEYVSSPYPKLEKLMDAAISAGFLRHEEGIDASAIVFSRDEVTEVPDHLIEETWRMIDKMAEILQMDDNKRLEYANPASGFCDYCANNLCSRNRMMQ